MMLGQQDLDRGGELPRQTDRQIRDDLQCSTASVYPVRSERRSRSAVAAQNVHGWVLRRRARGGDAHAHSQFLEEPAVGRSV